MAPQWLDEAGRLWVMEQDEITRADQGDQLERVSLADAKVGLLVRG